MPLWSHGSGPADLPKTAPVQEGKQPLPEMTDEQLLDAIAGRIVRMRLGVAAVFFLESSKPLSFVGSQALIFLQPFVEAFLTIRSYQRFAYLMEDRKNLERLIQRVEALDEEQRLAEKRGKQERKRKQAEAKARRRGELPPDPPGTAPGGNSGEKG